MALLLSFLLFYLLLCPITSVFHQRLVNRAGTTSLRFLEGNTWQIQLADVSILVDPVMSTLDFGIPALYRGEKKIIDGERELYKIMDRTDFVLISQGFDDHAHRPTLQRIHSINPNMRYIIPPSAVDILTSCKIPKKCIEVLSPGQSTAITARSTSVDIRATTGALLGPPWQSKENGYILRPIQANNFPSVYYEPHCMYEESELSKLSPVDIAIAPVTSQLLQPLPLLPSYTLVGGQEEASKLVQLLRAKYLVPMANGELEQSGPLAKLIRSKGSMQGVQSRLKELGLRTIKVVSAPPGEVISF
jgi:L-ascorbate metabolism protein UlaG (beta-lactamase superfamily)